MHPNEKIKKMIAISCENVANSISDEELQKMNKTALVHTLLDTIFSELKKSGFAMDIDEFLTTKVAKKSEQCIEIAKESIDTFKQTNSKLEDITQSHTIEIEKIADESKEIDVETFRNRFASFQEDLLEELNKANDIIQSLEKEIEELQKQSNIDPLTKLYNRKALEIDSLDLLKSTHKRDLKLVALMIDADDFKKVNDSFGHIAGDKVLVLLAKLLKMNIREYDRAYRYGGEEFLILFNRSTKEEAVNVANRILNAVRNNKLIYKNQIISITLSMGLTEHQRGDTIETFIERADAAVYQAKREGKDRLVVR